MANYGPSFCGAKLYRKTSAKGNTYFAGRMGCVKLALFKANETSESGEEIWHLMFSEATPYQSKDEAKASYAAPKERP